MLQESRAKETIYAMCLQCLIHGVFPQLIWLYLDDLIKDQDLAVSTEILNEVAVTSSVRLLTGSTQAILLGQAQLIIHMYCSLKDYAKPYYEKLADLEYLFGFNYSQKQIALVLKYSERLSLKDSVDFYPLPRATEEYKRFQKSNRNEKASDLLKPKTLYFVKLMPKNGGPTIYKWGITGQELEARFKPWLSKYGLFPLKEFRLTAQIAFVVEQIILNHFHAYSVLGLANDAQYETFSDQLNETEAIKFAYSALRFHTSHSRRKRWLFA